MKGPTTIGIIIPECYGDKTLRNIKNYYKPKFYFFDDGNATLTIKKI